MKLTGTWINELTFSCAGEHPGNRGFFLLSLPMHLLAIASKCMGMKMKHERRLRTKQVPSILQSLPRGHPIFLNYFQLDRGERRFRQKAAYILLNLQLRHLRSYHFRFPKTFFERSGYVK